MCLALTHQVNDAGKIHRQPNKSYKNKIDPYCALKLVQVFSNDTFMYTITHFISQCIITILILNVGSYDIMS